ncbi:MAG: family 43 glycosylhydrolase [Bacilli bacterium]|nr:family 43 glycosylhydrolase [Bacilli bacterium]
MKKQIFNPYLPFDEYIPDAEPHLFGDRVYIYGSHEEFDGGDFCISDHITYSAPANDLKDWRYEGVIFKRSDDPHNGKKGRSPLYAPDCIQGPDGKYYLYTFAAYHNEICVSVCDTPCGHFKPIGYVHHPDGTHLGRKKGDGFAFDPGVYVEGDDVYLYTGFGPEHYLLTLGKQSKEGCTCCKLEKDMMTIKEQKIIAKVKAKAKGTEWEAHPFFEAASMRKIGDKYYFMYSSAAGHELCYAIADRPDGDFHFGGVLVSIGDVGLGDHKDVKTASNFTGNTHGSILTIGDKHYVFYHRQTNRNCFSRQACAEEIKIEADGSIKQVEVTSCGLNGGPLVAEGAYPAYIACNLTCPKGGYFYSVFKKAGYPYFTQGKKDSSVHYIADFTNGCKAGFKYFDFKAAKFEMSVKVKGVAEGVMKVYDDEKLLGEIAIHSGKEMGEFKGQLAGTSKGKHALFFEFVGKGKLEFHEIAFC